MRVTVELNRPSPRRVASGIALLLALFTGPALAAHQFTDVPDSYTFHVAIDRVADAGIAAGCTATTYCPADPVSRGQMAAFLSRAGSRIAYDTANSVQQISTSSATPTVLATITIQPGGVSGGTAFVQVTASAHAQALSATGLPSTAHFRLREEGGPFLVGEGWSTLASVGVQSAGIVAVFTVPTGEATTYELVAFRDQGSGTLFSYGWLSAISVPFSENGDDSLGLEAASMGTGGNAVVTEP
jgi:hypothetical protein